MSKKVIKISGVTLTSDFPAQLQEAMRPAVRAFAETKLRHIEEGTWNLAGVEAEKELAATRAASGLMLWGMWHVQGTDGVVEELPYYSTKPDIPQEAIELFEGSQNCRLTLVPHHRTGDSSELSIALSLSNGYCVIEITAPRHLLGGLGDAVEELMTRYTALPDLEYHWDPMQRPFKVFIAYGGGRAWEAVRDFIRAEGFDVDAFSEEERAGRVIIDVVEEMIRGASVAVIVATAADTMPDGSVRARQNVIHEAGFAHALLGREHTIILREQDVDLPTNVSGIGYMEFARGEIYTLKDRLVSRLQALKARHDAPRP